MDLPDLSSVSGNDLTDEQLRGILAQIDLDITNLLRDGKLEEAQRVFTEVSKTNPEAFMHFYGLARIHVKRGNRDAARKSLEQALEHAPTPQSKAAIKPMLERLALGQTIDG